MSGPGTAWLNEVRWSLIALLDIMVKPLGWSSSYWPLYQLLLACVMCVCP